jgi:hypothetical protein
MRRAKEQLDHIQFVLDAGECIEYSVDHASSIIQCPDSVTVMDKGPAEGINVVQLVMRPIGIGIYPDRIRLTSVQDVRLIDVEIHVKELEHIYTLAFSAQMKSNLVQQIPLCNSSEKQITVTAEVRHSAPDKLVHSLCKNVSKSHGLREIEGGCQRT